jgi:S1-C subfamily serine protease
VLTARHVVVDARKVTVRLTSGAAMGARVIFTSPWDCAVLQLDGDADGVEPARLITNEEARFSRGDSFRSCGFGGDETFSVNSGKFLGFKRSSEQLDDSDDWMEITGPSRQGDSGGPIYDKNGKVAGILWGTDGDMTIGVQAGRLGIALNAAISQLK